MSIQDEINNRQIEIDSNKAYLEIMSNPIKIRNRKKRIRTLEKEIHELKLRLTLEEI